MTHRYEIAQQSGALRRTNRQQFVRESKQQDVSAQQSRISVLILCYNNIDNFFALLDTLNSEPQRDSFMITIVQNSDRAEMIEIFDKRIVAYTGITVIYPVKNVGSAGGYALGQEYLLSTGVSHIIMVEDDILLYENDTISVMISHIKNDKSVVFINAPVNTGGDHSRYVQCACFPASLLQQAGVIDPRYYFRGEDLEWKERLEHCISDHGYHKVHVSRHYYHPYIKAGNNAGAWMYYSLRNQLYTYRKNHQGGLHLFVVTMLYVSFALLVFLRTGKSILAACIFGALRESLRPFPSNLEMNTAALQHLSAYRPFAISDLGFTMQQQNGFPAEGVRVDHLFAVRTLSASDRQKLHAQQGVLLCLGGFQPVLGGFIAMCRKAFVIEHLQYDSGIIQGKIIRQSLPSLIGNFLLFLPSLFLGFLTVLIYLLVFIPLSFLLSKRYHG